LATTEYAIDRALVAGVAGALPDGPGRVAWDVLTVIDERSAVATRAVLALPFVRVRARRSLTSRRPEDGSGAAMMTALAVAAAVRARQPTSLDVRLERGTLALPGIGALHLPGVEAAVVSLTEQPSVMTVRPADGPSVVVPLDGTTHPGWHPVAMVGVGGPQLRLDDADPDRDCFTHPVTGRLSGADARRWAATLAIAWATVRADAPELARTLDQLVIAVTPTRPVVGRPAAASSTRAAFGAVAIPLAAPRTVAALLVEHVAKLTVAAVQDVCELYDSTPATAGWSHRARSSHTAGLAEAFARAARLELMAAHLRAGRSVDQPSVSRLRDSLARRLDHLDRGDRWTYPGQVLLSGLRGRLDRVAVA
jgi:uncharacterized protein